MKPTVQNPFPGLRPFRTDEDYLFFGREEQTIELVKLLREHRLLAVVGTSGSGKSSLVRAGLMPALQGGTMTQAGSTWEIVIMRPGGNPRFNLATALVDADFYDPEDEESIPRLEATLNRSRQGLVEAVKQSDVDEESNVLIVVDQFEELFRFGQRGIDSREAAGAFVKLLLHASDQTDCKIYIAITMRSDYLGDCAEIPGLAESVNDGEYLIPRLRRQQRRDAIEKPVSVGGATIAPRLVQKLLNEVGDNADQLPVMQHALMRTWDIWAGDHEADEPIDLRHYEASGRMEAALSHHADALYEALPDASHREAAKKLFETLTERGADNREIRRPNTLEQIIAISGADRSVIENVIEAYRQQGVTFLMPLADVELTPETVIDISHESLMRVWTRLRAWVEEEAQSARIFQRLSDTSRLHAEGKAGLYRDPDLQIARSWHEEQSPTAAWANQYGGRFDEAASFLEHSHATAEKESREQEEARQRELEQARALAETEAKASRLFKRSALAVAMLALVAMILAAWALDSRGKVKDSLAETEAANEAKDVVITESKHNQGVLWLERAKRQRYEKSLLGSQLSAARALGFEGFGRESCDEVFHEAFPPLLKPDSDEWREAAELIARPSYLTPIWGTPSSENLKTHVHPSISDDDTLIAAADHSANVLFWDGQTGEPLPSLTVSGMAHDVCFLSGHRLLVHLTNSLELWDLTNRKVIFNVEDTSGWASGERMAQAESQRALLAVANVEEGQFDIWDMEGNTVTSTVSIENIESLIMFTVDWTTERILLVYKESVMLQSMRGDQSVQSLPFEDGLEFGEGLFVESGDLIVVMGFQQAEERPNESRRDRAKRTERKLLVWDASSQELLHTYPLGARGDLITGSLLPAIIDKEAPIVCCRPRGLFNVRDGTSTPVPPGNIEGMSFDPRGRLLFSTMSKLQILKYPTLEPWRQGSPHHLGPINSTTFSPDGRSMLSSSADGVRVWATATGEQLQHLATKNASDIDFTSDGAVLGIAYWGEEGAVELWNPEDWTLINRIEEAATQVCISPQGDQLAYVGAKDRVHLIDLTNMQPLVAPLDPYPLPEEDDARPPRSSRPDENGRSLSAISSMAFSPNGNQLAIGLKSRSVPSEVTKLQVWDMNSQERPLTIATSRQDPSSVDGLTFSNDGQWMAWSTGNSIQLVNRLTNEVEELPGLDQSTRYSGALSFSSDGNWFAAGTDGRGALLLWRLASRECVASVSGHRGTVHALEFAPDSKTLLSAGDEGTLRLWEVGNTEIHVPPDPSGAYAGVRFLPDETLLGIASSGFHFISPETGEVQRRVKADLGERLITARSPLSSDSQLLFKASFGQEPLSAVDIHTGEVRWTAPNPAMALVLPRDQGVALWNQRGEVEFWDKDLTGPQSTFKMPDFQGVAYAVNQDGTSLAYFRLGEIVLVDGPEFSEVSDRFALNDSQSFIMDIKFSPSNPNWLGCVTPLGGLKVFDRKLGQSVYESPGILEPNGGGSPFAGRMFTILWTPDGKHLLVRGLRNDIRMIEVPSGREVATFNTDSTARLETLDSRGERSFIQQKDFDFTVSPDGKHLAITAFEDGISIWPLAAVKNPVAPRLVEVLDYLSFAESAAKPVEFIKEGELGHPKRAPRVERPEALTPRLETNIFEPRPFSMAPYSKLTHVSLLQAETSEEQRTRSLYQAYMRASNWHAAAAVLRKAPENELTEERDHFVESIVDAVGTGKNVDLALVWLDLAERVQPGSAALKTVRESLLELED